MTLLILCVPLFLGLIVLFVCKYAEQRAEREECESNLYYPKPGEDR